MFVVSEHIQSEIQGWENYCCSWSEMRLYQKAIITENEGDFIPVYAGSRAEGFAMEPCIGYDKPDLDVMFVYRGGWVVRLPHCADWRYMASQALDGCTDDNLPHLRMCEDECPAGYCKVKVNGSPKELIGRLAKATDYYQPNIPTAMLGSDRARDCLSESEGSVWLSSSNTVEIFRQFLSVTKENISGPASHLDAGITELIVTLMCSGTLPATRDFHSRQRQGGWPRQEILDRMQIAPGMLVCASHKLSSDDKQALQFRFSFSLQELMLARDMPGWVKQGYTAFKLTVKSLLTRHRHSIASEGRSMVCSYHLKTVLFWTLEDSECWYRHCPFQLFIRLLTSLRTFITKSPPVIPNYFIPECNLFAHTDRLDIELLLQVVTQIQADPFKCILDVPISPGLLYGVGPVIRDPHDWDELASSYRDLLKEGVGATKEELQDCFQMLTRSNPNQRPFRWLLAGCLFYRVERYRKWLWEVFIRRDLEDENKLDIVYRRPRPRQLMAIWRGLKEHVSSWERRSNNAMRRNVNRI